MKSSISFSFFTKFLLYLLTLASLGNADPTGGGIQVYIPYSATQATQQPLLFEAESGIFTYYFSVDAWVQGGRNGNII
jgi:hypothetical protein